MSPELITAIAALVAACGGVVAALLSYRGKNLAADAKKEIVAVGDKLYLLDKRVDGRLTQLLEQARAEGVTNANLARSEGHAAGEQAQRDRSSEAQG